MKYQVLFSLKNNEKLFMNVACCSCDWLFKSKVTRKHKVKAVYIFFAIENCKTSSYYSAKIGSIFVYNMFETVTPSKLTEQLG